MGTRARIGSGLIVVCVLAASCGRAIFTPPAGPGTPAPDAAAAWTQATATCGQVKTFVASLRVSGRVGSQRLWPVDIETAVTADQSIYLNAVAGGQSVFVLSGSKGQASLWLRSDHRLVTARTSDILEAIVGVAFSPDQLLAILAGCVARETSLVRAAQHDRLLEIETRDARVYLAQASGAWRVRAAQADAFTVEYGGESGPAPPEIWIWSAPGSAARASLHIRATEITTNKDVPADFFEVPGGARTAAPMTIEELRANGPLRQREPDPQS